MLRKSCILAFNLLFLLTNYISAQHKAPDDASIMFYNTENFFDIYDDPAKGDNDFLPTSKRHWNKEKYLNKINNLSKVILSTGIEPPIIVGFAEVENLAVLQDLTQKTPLVKFKYKIIHHESPDPRGIDAALIYRSDIFKILSEAFIKVKSTKSVDVQTREIVYVNGIYQQDTLHFFINHWPSRRGGLSKSAPKRALVAKLLLAKIDSINNKQPNAKVIVMGDFNDEPDDKSIKEILVKGSEKATNKLVNLSESWLKDISWKGTYKFKGHWGIFDQIIVTQALLSSKKGEHSIPENAKIYYQDFLLTDETKNNGKTPFKTYNGFKYAGGFSDHLPVLLELSNNN
jgi:endonuclease/exonuclease/phosphatase family metal-dependent hydrolase